MKTSQFRTCSSLPVLLRLVELSRSPEDALTILRILTRPDENFRGLLDRLLTGEVFRHGGLFRGCFLIEPSSANGWQTLVISTRGRVDFLCNASDDETTEKRCKPSEILERICCNSIMFNRMCGTFYSSQASIIAVYFYCCTYWPRICYYVQTVTGLFS